MMQELTSLTHGRTRVSTNIKLKCSDFGITGIMKIELFRSGN